MISNDKLVLAMCCWWWHWWNAVAIPGRTHEIQKPKWMEIFKSYSFLRQSSTSTYLSVAIPTLPDLTMHYLTLPYLAFPYRTVPYRTLPYLTLPYLPLPYFTLPYRTLPHLVLLPIKSPCLLSMRYRKLCWSIPKCVVNDILKLYQTCLDLPWLCPR